MSTREAARGELAGAAHLANEERAEGNLLRVAHFAKVVDQVGRRQQIERGQGPLPARVITVTMDGKHWELDVVVWVLEVDGAVGAVQGSALVGHHLHAHVAVAEAVVAQHLNCGLHGLATRLVVVKEVAGDEYHIGVLGHGNLKDLLERVVRVVLANRVALVDAQVDV